jgi:hypothetical protein
MTEVDGEDLAPMVLVSRGGDLEATVDAPAETAKWSPAGLKELARRITWLYFRPSKLFAALGERNFFGPALLVLLMIASGLTQAQIATGIGDYEIDRWTERQIAKTAELHFGSMPQSQLDDQLDSLDRGRAFWKLLDHLETWARGPLRIAIATFLVSAGLYAIAAVAGSKANFDVLQQIVVFAMYVEIPCMALQLLLMQGTGVARVEMSAAAFVSSPEVGPVLYALLRQVSPFAIWFWSLVGMGLYETGQATLRTTIGITLFLGVLSAAWNFPWDLLRLVDFWGAG